MGFFKSLKETFDHLHSYDPSSLARAVRSLHLSKDKVFEHLPEPTDLAYGRTVVYKSENMEVFLIYLPSLSKTAIHDHSHSSGCIYVVEGHLLNVLYTKTPQDPVPIYDGTEVFCTGDMFYVEGDSIHMMYNPTLSPVITFHVYAPPLQNGKIYDP